MKKAAIKFGTTPIKDSLIFLKRIKNIQNIAIITHLGPILAVAKHLNYKIPNVKNLDGIVITYVHKTYKLKTHNKLIH